MNTETPQTEKEAAGGQSRAGEAGANLTDVLCGDGSAKECEHDYKCTYDGMDGERYRCTKCGDSYYLDYDEMR